MRVALDATPVITGRTGIAIYVTELAAALERRGVDVRLFAVGRRRAPLPPGCRRLAVPSRLVHWSWSVGGPPRPERVTGPVDLVHATALLPPPSRHPVVATVHDLTPLDHPDLHDRRQVVQARHLVRHLRRARIVLAVSEATAAALVAHGVPRDRVAVAHPGLTTFPAAAPGPAPAPVEGPYLLALGEQMPRKGLDVLLRALAALGRPELRVVHAGPASTQTAALRSLARDLGVEAQVTWLGYVERAELATLLRGAVALCFPSRAEGFGFPVLEAMALATPVVASDIPPVREVAGDAAVLVPAGDPSALAEAIESLLDDAPARAALAAKGPARAAGFTWDACAAATAAAYERALAGS